MLRDFSRIRLYLRVIKVFLYFGLHCLSRQVNVEFATILNTQLPYQKNLKKLEKNNVMKKSLNLQQERRS